MEGLTIDSNKNDNIPEALRKSIETSEKLKEKFSPTLEQQKRMQQLVEGVNIPKFEVSSQALDAMRNLTDNSALRAVQDNVNVMKLGTLQMSSEINEAIATVNNNALKSVGELSIKSSLSNYQFDIPAIKIWDDLGTKATANLISGLNTFVNNSAMREIQAITSRLGKWLQTIDFSPLTSILENIRAAGFDHDYREVNDVFLKAMFDAKWFPYAGWIASFRIVDEMLEILNTSRPSKNRIRLKENNYLEWHSKDSFVCKPLPLDKAKFDNPDNDPRGLWKADPFDAPNVRPNLTYVITNPLTGEQHLPPRGRHWRISQEKFSSALADGRIIFGKNGTGRPQMKSFYEEKKEFGSIDNSWFSAERVGTTTNGTKEVMNLFDGKPYFDKPKPTTLLSKLIDLANVSDGEIILDFFSGSATTAHAVMQLNAEDGGNRKFIMVQLPEETDEKSEAYKAGYKNICEIGKERIRRAAKKIAEKNPEAQFDGGFRVLKCDSSNMKDVYYNPTEYQPSLFSSLEDNIKEDRTPEDLLFQVMLDLGVLLSSKIEETTIAGKKVFNVEDNYLIACFDEDITDVVITEIAKQKPYYFVMRDSSMANDSVATNFEQIFTVYSPDTVRKVL